MTATHPTTSPNGSEKSPTSSTSFRLRAVRQLAYFQFGVDGELFFPDSCEVEVSPSTGKVRRVWLGGQVLATVRPADGYLSLTFEGARRLSELLNRKRMYVVVDEEGRRRVLEGFDVSAANIVEADRGIVPGMEVLVYGAEGGLLAVGKAVLSGVEMLELGRGTAVKVRHRAPSNL